MYDYFVMGGFGLAVMLGLTAIYFLVRSPRPVEDDPTSPDGDEEELTLEEVLEEEEDILEAIPLTEESERRHAHHPHYPGRSGGGLFQTDGKLIGMLGIFDSPLPRFPSGPATLLMFGPKTPPPPVRWPKPNPDAAKTILTDACELVWRTVHPGKEGSEFDLDLYRFKLYTTSAVRILEAHWSGIGSRFADMILLARSTNGTTWEVHPQHFDTEPLRELCQFIHAGGDFVA